MPIENRDLPAGTVLTATYKKELFTCAVEAGEGDKLVYRLAKDGKAYTSPSAAGSAVMGGVACNGWRFWSVGGGGQPGEGEQAPAAQDSPAKPPRNKKAPKAKAKQVRKMPNQAGLEPGQSRWFCSACMAGFVADGETVPEACPQGHPREVEDELDSVT